MTALRAGIALYAMALAACTGLLGVHDVTLNDATPDGATPDGATPDGATPDGATPDCATFDDEPVTLSFPAVSQGVAQQPLDVITVEIQDVQGKPATKFNCKVVLALGNNPVGATLIGTLTATATEGTARFDAVGIDRPGLGYTLVASTKGAPAATSSAFDVVVPRFTPVATGIRGGSISGIAVSPAPAGGTATVFAGAADGVYKSTDLGASWKPATFGADAASHLLADPSHPGVVYLQHTDSFQRPNSLKKTVDGGATWHEIDFHGQPPSAISIALALDPKNPSVIYAGGEKKTLRSSDGGASWTDLALEAFCVQIAVDPVTSDTVYCAASTLLVGEPLGVYRSSNGGTTWGPANTGLGELNVRFLVATPTGVFAGVGPSNMLYRSIDAGASWTSMGPSFSNAYTMAYAPSMPDRIYLSYGSGIAVSNDGGASFGSPITFNEVMSGIAVDPTNADVVYAAGLESGVFVSTNGGVTWSPSSKGIDAHQVRSVVFAPGTSGTLLTTTNVSPTSGAVLRSINSGASWTKVSQANAIARLDPSVSTRVYLCGRGYFATSTDSGATFTGHAGLGLAPDYCDNLVIAGTKFFAAGFGVFKSTDSGAHWAGTDLDSNVFFSGIALGDATGEIVVAAGTTGIFRSTNGGTSFTQVTTDPVYGALADPTAPAHIVVGQCGSVLVSSDAGATFQSVAIDLCVQPLGSVGSALYASGIAYGFRTFSLLTSTDGGSSWTPVDTTGLPRGVSFTSFAASDDGSTIYLGTIAGLYKGAGR